jgi:hypothetical protein
MTALAGFWSFDHPKDPARACERMLAAQQVYAPAAPICRSDGSLCLGRRLRTLLSEDRCDRAQGDDDNVLVLVTYKGRESALGGYGGKSLRAAECSDARHWIRC